MREKSVGMKNVREKRVEINPERKSDCELCLWSVGRSGRQSPTGLPARFRFVSVRFGFNFWCRLFQFGSSLFGYCLYFTSKTYTRNVILYIFSTTNITQQNGDKKIEMFPDGRVKLTRARCHIFSLFEWYKNDCDRVIFYKIFHSECLS